MIATGVPSDVCIAATTSPIPPMPSVLTTLYFSRTIVPAAMDGVESAIEDGGPCPEPLAGCSPEVTALLYLVSDAY